MLSYMKQLITSADSSSNGSSSRHRAAGVLVITLHQPGMELTSLLDDLLLLAPGGRCVYAGPWAGGLHYFSGRLGLAPPPHTGLAEWFLSLLTAQGHPNNSTSSDSSSSNRSSSSHQQAAAVDLHAAWQDFTAQGSCAGQLAVQVDARQLGFEPKQLQGQGSCTVIKVVVGGDAEEGGDAGVEAAQSAERREEAADVQLAEVATSAWQERRQVENVDWDAVGSGNSHAACPPGSLGSAQWQQHSEAMLQQGASGGGAAGFRVQVTVLALRSLRWWWRNPAMIVSGALWLRAASCTECSTALPVYVSWRAI
jgi:hypothetical protein